MARASTAATAEPVKFPESTEITDAPDLRVRRIAALLGQSKQAVVGTLGPPTELAYSSGAFTYRGTDWEAFLQFFDPERDQSLFHTQTRGAAATLAACLVRVLQGEPSMAAALRALDVTTKPAYMRVSRESLAWQLQNYPNLRHYAIAVGGRDGRGYAYEIVGNCGTPPLTGRSTFNYQTNRTEIATLAPNPAFDWRACTPVSVRMNARQDWTGYRLFDDAHEIGGTRPLNERVALDGSPLPGDAAGR